MSNDLFRDLLENRIPGHETPRTVAISITPGISAFRELLDLADEGLRAYRQAMWGKFQRLVTSMAAETTTFTCTPPVDYGAQQGLTGTERDRFNEGVEKLAHTTRWSRDKSAEIMGNIMKLTQNMQDLGLIAKPAPADPRARALWAKEQQGHGPAQEPLRVRGRNNHYKEKR